MEHMSRKYLQYAINAFAIITLLFASACNLPMAKMESTVEHSAASTVAAIVTQTLEAQKVLSQNETAIAATVSAQLEEKLKQTESPAPTPSASFTAETPLVSVTNTEATFSLPCNWAGFISDVTYPDNSVVPPGKSFVKTWRFINQGSCPWTSQYQVIFDSGDKLNAPAAVPLTNSTVPPKSYVDVSINLTAPSIEGIYQAFFRFKAPNGEVFGIGSQANGPFWVKIVVQGTPPPTIVGGGLPDLTVQSYSANPATVFVDNPTEISIVVKNKGAGAAGTFDVKWFSGEGSSSPACSWNITSLSPNESTPVLSCTYIFHASGTYSSTITVDTENNLAESNETNNDKVLPIKVQKLLILTPLKPINPITPVLPINPIFPIVTLSP